MHETHIINVSKINAKEMPMRFLKSSKSSGGSNANADDTIVDFTPVIFGDTRNKVVAEVEGDALTQSGIYNGDLLVIDQKEWPEIDDLVVIYQEGDLIVRKLIEEDGKQWLITDNPRNLPILVTNNKDILLFGVVFTHIRRHKNKKPLL